MHTLIQQAAELQGRSMTDFVVSTAQEAAQRVIEQTEVIRVPLADQLCFAEALIAPPEPNTVLINAFQRREKLLRSA